MQHFHLLYLFIAILVGMITLSIFAIDYQKRREKHVLNYLLFQTSFILLLVSDSLEVYVSLNLPELHSMLFGILEYFSIFIAQYIIMFSFPMLIHGLFNVPQARIKNIFFLTLSGLLCVAEHVQFYILHAQSDNMIINDIDNLALVLVFFYGFVTSISEYKNCDPGKKQVAKNFIVLLGVFMPVIIIDVLLYDTLPVLLYPAVFCVLSINFTYHVLTQSTQRKDFSNCSDSSESTLHEVHHVVDNQLLSDEVFRQFNISPRERELIPLIIQGQSNNQIAETLFISLSTVKTHLRSIYHKFQVANRYELVAFLKHGDQSLLPKTRTE